MSDHQFALEITVPESALTDWVTLVEGLCEGQLGAYLEERLEALNPAALALMDSTLNDWCHSRPSFFDFEQRGNQLRCNAEGLSGFYDQLETFKQALTLCGAEVAGRDKTQLDR